MNLALLAGGIALVLFIAVDVFWTTLATQGAGPLTDFVSQTLWKAARLIGNHTRSHRFLSITGPVILLSVLGIWVVLTWAGWTLIFLAQEDAVVSSQARHPAELPARLYFVGYTLLTLGIGDYVPANGGWQIVTTIASANGLILLTLAISYLLPVLSAAAEARRLAGMISSMGKSPAEILLRAWNGHSFEALDQLLIQLGHDLELHAQRHYAYPVLHYFHSGERRTATQPSLAVLYDMVQLLRHGVAPEVRLSEISLRCIDETITNYLRVLDSLFLHIATEPAPFPALEALRKEGIPMVSDEQFQESLKARQEERKLLLAAIEQDGWTWSEV